MKLSDQILAVAAAITALGAAVVVLAKGARWMRQRLRKIDRFLEDWFGDASLPEEDERRLGVMARVRRLERQMTIVTKQLKPNGGQGPTVADAVSRLDLAQGGPGVRETKP